VITLVAVMVGAIVWTITWAFDLKGFDGFLLMLLIVLGAATFQLLAPYLPGNRDQDAASTDPAPFT
jgi:hypothetical protein